MASPDKTPLEDPLVACDQPECTRTDHTIGYLRAEVVRLRRIAEAAQKEEHISKELDDALRAWEVEVG